MIHKIQIAPTVQKYKLLPNIPYCCVNGHTLCLNILMPDNRPPSGAPTVPDAPPTPDTRFPLLIYLAGGGFRFTDPFSWLPMLTYFCERGYIVATVDYRCSGESKFPAAIQDVKCAIRFLRKNAYEYEIDPAKITLMGDSAGGYLAVMTGCTNGNPKFETAEYQEYSSEVQCVCDYFAPINFLTLNESCENSMEDHNASRSPESEFLGAALPTIPEICQAANPLNYISSNTPPTIIFHGTDDRAVGPGQSVELYETLTASGIPTELYLIENAGHVGPEFHQPEVLSLVDGFIKKHLDPAN